MKNIIFFRLSASSLVASSITTLIVHLVHIEAGTPEERVLLFQNGLYIARNWLTIVHCVLVITSMIGLGMFKLEEAKGWIIAGLIFYFIFSFTEICRMYTANVLINGLREQYYFSQDEEFKSHVRVLLEVVWPLVGEEMFLLFMPAFALGNICYAIAFSSVKIVGVSLLIWGVMNVAVFINAFVENAMVDQFISVLSYTFQPAVRFVLGIWMFRMMRK